MQQYDDVSFRISKVVTCSYSSSFSRAASFFNSETRNAIYSIYGFVRLTDEIVDTFHEFDKEKLLSEFENDYYRASKDGISLNPVLNSFQLTVKKYYISDDLIQAFLNSMRKDLTKKGSYTKSEMNEYIFGSAEVVGLMCLSVFTDGQREIYDNLKVSAMKLGSAFQKVNFLRDIKDDIFILNRSYFPELKIETFGEEDKEKITRDINDDFSAALEGISKLPENAKLPVLIAYYYYKCLLNKIRKTPAEKLLKTRISVPAVKKIFLIAEAWLAIKMKKI